nr:hypothetical protein CTI12_AA060390 [Tanacetum cinerariifolium]
MRKNKLVPFVENLDGNQPEIIMMKRKRKQRTRQQTYYDGKLRHPADGLAWKDFDEKNPEFATDPLNVRLVLASDGFNPFKTMNVSYSIWLVIVIPYNLPPWYVIKQPNFILSLIIPGPKAHGNKIDVYIQPLIKELKDLWGRVKTFDACARENFKLKAIVLSTISDFLGYANLSGWSTKGEYACLVCAYDKTSKWLDHGRKWCYMGHQRWLEHDHCWLRDIRSFDGNEDLIHAPIPHSEDDVLNEIENINLNNENDFRGPWKKKSIFFKLPYWKSLLLPHNLDVMHIEKNLNKRKLIGMKSYDCHMLMQEYLPIALRGTLPDHVSIVLIELCDFFRRICLKDLDENDLRKKSAAYEIDEMLLTQAHRYVLFNVDSIPQFREEHKNVIKGKHGYVGYLSLSLKRFIASNLVNGLESGVASGIKFGITLVNLSHLTHSGSDKHDDPFVFASQVDKVFYDKDPQLEGWLVARHIKVKDAFNMGCNSDQNSLYSILDTCDVPSFHRIEVDGDEEIDVTESVEDEDEEEEEEEEDTY